MSDSILIESSNRQAWLTLHAVRADLFVIVTEVSKLGHPSSASIALDEEAAFSMLQVLHGWLIRRQQDA